MIALNTYIDQNSQKVESVLGSIKPVGKVSTDTRAILEGDLFLALTGENFDGNKYLFEAIKKGAMGCIYKESEDNNEKVSELFSDYPEVFFIGVKCTEVFFQGLASFHLSEWKKLGNKNTIGITGSNGKTTAKELMAGLLDTVFPNKTLYTQGNLNNHLGVPMTILRLDKSFDICILEMGTNHPGEIRFLCELGDPDSGIITSIGQSHLEFFENESNVFKEKRSLYDYVNSKGGNFSVDADNPFLKLLEKDTKLQKVSFEDGTIDYSHQTLKFKNEAKEITCPHLVGKHNFKNLAVVLCLLIDLFPKVKKELFEAAKEIKLPENNRSQFIKNENQIIFLDAYNANPSSMKAALDSFKNYLIGNKLSIKKSLFVLGDMNELGSKSEEYHKEIGKILKEMGVDHAIFVGRFSKDYGDGFSANAKLFDSTSDLKKEWAKVSKDFTSVFLKGSRTLQLESLMTALST